METFFSNTISCAKVGFTSEQGGRLPLDRQQKVVTRTQLSIAYRRRSFRKMTLRFLMPTQVKLAIACCFSLVALVSRCTRETVQLPSFPTQFPISQALIFFKPPDNSNQNSLPSPQSDTVILPPFLELSDFSNQISFPFQLRFEKSRLHCISGMTILSLDLRIVNVIIFSEI